MFYAVDRELIAKTVYYGYARPGTSPIFSPNTEFYHARHVQHRATIPKKAAALLDAAGYPKKADGKRFTLNLVAAGWFAENGKIGAIVKQGARRGRHRRQPRGARPRRPRSSASTPTTTSTSRSPTRPIRPSRCRRRRSTTPPTASRRACRSATPRASPSAEMDALVEKIRVETEPAKRKALVVDFQKIATQEASQPAAGRARDRSPSPAPGCRTTPTIPTTSRQAGTTSGWRPSSRLRSIRS